MIPHKVFGMAAGAVAFGLSAAAHAVPWVLDFEDFGAVDFVHGTVVDSEYAGQIPGAAAGLGVAISTVNIGGGPALAVAFNTQATGTLDDDPEAGATGFTVGTNSQVPVTTPDPATEDPNTASHPNSRIKPGHVLIIQENSTGCSTPVGDEVRDAPDDEGSQPAGTITFAFSAGVDLFGLDVYDIEENGQNPGKIRFFAEGVDSSNASNAFASLSIPTTEGAAPPQIEA